MNIDQYSALQRLIGQLECLGLGIEDVVGTWQHLNR